MSAGPKRDPRREIEALPGIRSLCHGMSAHEPAPEDTPPLLIVGPYTSAENEARARGLTRAQWRHVARIDQVQGTARGSRFVIVGPRPAAQAGRLAEITDMLAARDAVEEAPVY